ncbi:MAG TPA: hypothetical protein PKA70_03530 [Saprospiraceae bacterium]|nr:hypothetical protein [Saprospiraceae bacterium]
MKQSWLIVALINLLIATAMGALLRFAFVEEIAWIKYKNVLHAHSHVAMLGWIYMALYALLIHAFLSPHQQRSKAYPNLFWLTQFSVLGMLFSFPVQGYGPVSIAFSTLHIVLSYIFLGWFWVDMGKHATFSGRLVRTALVFMLVSTLGVWAMGPIMATSLRGSAFYYMAVQFYLHFQFNGWFLFAVLALFFKYMETREVLFAERQQKVFLGLLLVACVLTYALAVAWSQPLLSVFAINSLGVLCQFAALLAFVRMVWPQRQAILQQFGYLDGLMLRVAFYAFVLKIIIQTAVVFPFVAEAAYTIRNYVIGFIHLVLLGAVTGFLLSYIISHGLLPGRHRLFRLGLWSIGLGFALSEGILFLQGTLLWGAKGFLPYYYEGIFSVSALIPFGVALLLVGVFFDWKKA